MSQFLPVLQQLLRSIAIRFSQACLHENI